MSSLDQSGLGDPGLVATHDIEHKGVIEQKHEQKIETDLPIDTIYEASCIHVTEAVWMFWLSSFYSFIRTITNMAKTFLCVYWLHQKGVDSKFNLLLSALSIFTMKFYDDGHDNEQTLVFYGLRPVKDISNQLRYIRFSISYNFLHCMYVWQHYNLINMTDENLKDSENKILENNDVSTEVLRVGILILSALLVPQLYYTAIDRQLMLSSFRVIRFALFLGLDLTIFSLLKIDDQGLLTYFLICSFIGNSIGISLDIMRIILMMDRKSKRIRLLRVTE